MEIATLSSPSMYMLRDLYSRILRVRMVDEWISRLHEQGHIDHIASCRGHEAAQVGSALCIEVGTDFTLPYYRDLGVVLTIGMTPYEVFRACLQAQSRGDSSPLPEASARDEGVHATTERPAPVLHWGYQKHNMITGATPAATHILHAAGIAFACKLRKAPAVTVAYCGDGATADPDFLEGVHFAVLHRLPVIFICEQDCPEASSTAQSTLSSVALPAGIERLSINGANVLSVYTTMQAAMQRAREGRGPLLLEMYVTRPTPDVTGDPRDPLLRCQQLLEEQGAWDDGWAQQVRAWVEDEVEQAWRDALRDDGGESMQKREAI
ncbi:MAG: thiamine pyrophosphate-dependent dehydrogenase E1 component subunit alpha [Chloroflexota bacterium]|nr:thiamine pyrophosphate-dependent dehydrogenase E1 component subunit alpha [Chloroflexota bacterium]